MTSSPQVSIVLPVYNGAKYLAEAIESCISQTFVDWELIIVDDASTDETSKIIAQYCKRDIRIRTVRHEVNRKLPATLNTGFSLTHGDLITWTSDDNYYHREALESLVSFIEANPEVDVVYSDYIRIDDAGRELEICNVRPIKQLIHGNVIGACFLYRRNVQETLGGYDENLFLAEDFDFWMRSACLFRLSPFHKVLYSYRVHDGSLTRTYRQNISLAHEKVVLRYLPLLPWVTAKMKAAAYCTLARRARAQKMYIRALNHQFCAVCALFQSLFCR